MPVIWETILFNYDGQPTRDPAIGKPLEWNHGSRPLRDLVYKIYDEPESVILQAGQGQTEHHVRDDYDEDNDDNDTKSNDNTDGDEEKTIPYPQCYHNMNCKLSATSINGVYLRNYDDNTDAIIEALPRMPEDEAALLYDLLSKIFVYDPPKTSKCGTGVEPSMVQTGWSTVGCIGLDR